MKSQLAVIVSDLHCGSDVALAPPKIESRAGNITSHGKNYHQAWLWKCWLEMVNRVESITKREPSVLIVNGDAIEGEHHRNNKDLIEQEEPRQISIAAQCLKPLVALCSTRYLVSGTECHTKHYETLLAEKIGAVGNKARDKWLIEINGCLIDAAHHMGTTSRAYLEASLMSIQMGNARLNYARCGHRIPQVYLRAHRHCGGYFSDMAGMFCVTGAWQMLTRHGFKVVTDSIPRPSALVLDWRGKKHGELPQVHEIKFNPPQNEIQKA